MGTRGGILARRAAASVASALLLATACQANHASSEEITPAPFVSADIDGIVLGPSDAPKGTAYVDGVSGFQDLDAFARDAVERAHLVDDGFEIGHLSLFFPARHTAGTAQAPLSNRSLIVQGITGLFLDAAGAQSSLERYVQDLRSRQLPDAQDVPAQGLGDASFGLRGTTPDGARVQIFAWRIGNLVLAISGSGPVAPAEVRALADLIDGRT